MLKINKFLKFLKFMYFMFEHLIYFVSAVCMKAFIFYAYATAAAALIGHSLLGQSRPTSLSNRLPSSYVSMSVKTIIIC